MNTIILFDTETTGLLKPKLRRLSDQPFIIEYCFKKITVANESELSISDVETISGFLKPPIKLPNIITKITGIRDDTLVDAPVFIDKVDEITEFFLGVDTMVAHNLPFDRSMLANELLRLDKVLNFPWPPNHICTVEKTIHMKGYRLSLEKLFKELFPERTFNAHRASDDVNAMTLCFKSLLRKGIIKI